MHRPLAQTVVVVPHAWFASHVAADVVIPPEHDCGGPHDVPGGSLPVSTQTEVPVAHEVVPVLQGLSFGLHASTLQATQLPALHTWSVPHGVPFCMKPVSVQMGMPVLQVYSPA